MKTCHKCKLEKLFEAFYKNKGTSDGYQYYCIECNKLRRLELKNNPLMQLEKEIRSSVILENKLLKRENKRLCQECKEVFLIDDLLGGHICKECNTEKSEVYRLKNKEKIREYLKEYHEKNNKKTREYYKEYIKKNRKKRREYLIEYREKNKEKIKEEKKDNYEKNKEKIKEYNEKNKEHRREYNKEYYEKNKEKIREKRREYQGEYKKKYRLKKKLEKQNNN